MSKYIPHTKEDTKTMLDYLNLDSLDSLYTHIDKSLINHNTITDKPLKEFELTNLIEEKFKDFKPLKVFRGHGAYEHYIPSIVDEISNKSEFVTSYTPYQSEVSQGTLEYIFEFQSLLTRLTGMEYCNASMYCSSTALAEAVLMCSQSKHRLLVLDSLNKDILEVVRTYTQFRNISIEIISYDDLLKVDNFDSEIFGVVVQLPNVYGYIEDIKTLSDKIHLQNINLILHVDPITLGILNSPKELNCDVCVLDLQTLGIPLSFGGPYNSCILTNSKYLRKLPGRIVGQTVDKNNNTCYVLTLTAREQHIRREKATSNICSNQSLMCLRNVVYLASIGNTLSNIDLKMIENSHYLYDLLIETKLFEDPFNNQNFIKEFTLKPLFNYNKLDNYLLKRGYLGPVSYFGYLIFCVTETKSKEDIIDFVSEVKKYAL